MNNFRMGDIIPLIEAEATKQGVDPKTAVAIFISENTSDGQMAPEKSVSLSTQGIDPATGKPSGALGLMQVTGTTLQGLVRNGYLPPTIDYSTLQGQITAGVAAVKEAGITSGNPADPFAVAAQYANGNAGTLAYQGKIPMMPQLTGYLPKMSRATGMSLSTKVAPPEVKGAMADSVTNFNNTMNRDLPMLRAMGVERDVAASNMKNATQAAGDANTRVIQSAGNREAADIAQSNSLLGLFGINPADQSSALIDQMAKFNDGEHQAAGLKPAIDALMAINPLANPVKWIAAQFQLGSLVPQYNAAINNQSQAADNITTRQTLDAKQKSLTPAVTIDQVQQETRAKAELSAATAKAQLAKIDMENLHARAQFLMEEMQMANNGVQMNAAQYRLLAEQLSIRQDDKLKAAEQDQLNKINVTRTSFGLPTIPTMAQFKSLPKDQQDFFINTTTDAPTPGKAVAFAMQTGAVPAMQQTLGLGAKADFIANLAQAAKPDIPALRLSDPKASDVQIMTRAVDNKVAAWRKEIETGDMLKASPDNPYRMKADQFAKAPGLEANSIAKFVRGEGAALPNVGEKEILAYAAGQVKAGRDVHAIAQDVEDFFSKGSEFQFKAYGMGTMGFDPRTLKNKNTKGELQRSYGVSDNIFGWRGFNFFDAPEDRTPVQLMNASSIEHFLVLSTVRSATSQRAGSVFQNQGVKTSQLPNMSSQQP